MSRALPGEHLCRVHQGNHSHYSTENCAICKLKTDLADREAVIAKRKAEIEQLLNMVRQIAAVKRSNSKNAQRWVTFNVPAELANALDDILKGTP